jgi:hypothetical protein
MGIGDWGLGPIPIPNPHFFNLNINLKLMNKLNKKIIFIF